MKDKPKGSVKQWLGALWNSSKGRTIVFSPNGPNAGITVVVLEKRRRFKVLLPEDVVYNEIKGRDQLKEILPTTVVARSVVRVRASTPGEGDPVMPVDPPPAEASKSEAGDPAPAPTEQAAVTDESATPPLKPGESAPELEGGPDTVPLGPVAQPAVAPKPVAEANELPTKRPGKGLKPGDILVHQGSIIEVIPPDGGPIMCRYLSGDLTPLSGDLMPFESLPEALQMDPATFDSHEFELRRTDAGRD